MDPEERKVDNGGNDKQRNSARHEVTSEVFLKMRYEKVDYKIQYSYHGMTFLPNIENIPQVNHDGGTNGKESEEADHLTAQGTCEEYTSERKP